MTSLRRKHSRSISTSPRRRTRNPRDRTKIIKDHSVNDHAVVTSLTSEQIQQQQISSSEEPQQDATFNPTYSSFINTPLGHSRPLYYQQEGAYSQRAVSPYQQQLTYDKFRGGDSYIQNSESNSYGILGSGNFGIIPGGTFFNDNDEDASNFNQHYNSYYHNGHGRPSWFLGGAQNPPPAQHEQFADFRDFADINTPSYSQFVVVYANKNSSKIAPNVHIGKSPKNILEQLALLDGITTTAAIPKKKLSKSKRKLAMVLPEKKDKRKASTVPAIDSTEPLLALS